MTNRDVAVLLTKLFGLWLSLSFPLALAGAVQTWSWTDRTVQGGMPATAIFPFLLPSLVYLGIGIPLWFSGERVARFIFPEERILGSTAVSHEGLLALGLSLMGVYLLAEGIPALVNALSLVALSYQSRQSVLGPQALTPEQRALWFDANAKAHVAEAITRVVIGVVLILGPNWLRGALSRAKREVFGAPLDEQAEADESESRG